MKEIILYVVLGCCSLFVFGFSIHMIIGGMVTPSTEFIIIGTGCAVALAVMGVMAWDVVRQRRRK